MSLVQGSDAVGSQETSATRGSHWVSIMLLFTAGCTVALHIGKVPSAIPELRQFWQLSLTQISLIVSLFALLIASLGIVMGFLVERFGYTRFAIAGVGTVGVASFAGAYAPDFASLLLTRIAEGSGWIIAAIALPPLLNRLCLPRDRPVVMGMWGAFVPLGAGVMLLLSPSLQAMGGWQLSWRFCGIASVFAAFVVLMICRGHVRKFDELKHTGNGADFSDLRKSVSWLISGCFLMYSFQFTSVTSFLPSLLLDISDWTLAGISYLVALVVISNAIGNIMAGFLVRKGCNPSNLLLLGLSGAGCCAFVLFNDSVVLPVRLAAAFGFSMVGGLVPGTCFGLLAGVASHPAGVGLLIGLMLQCSGLGQLAGPIVLAATVDLSGSWQSAGLLAMGISLLGVALSIKLRRHGL